MDLRKKYLSKSAKEKIKRQIIIKSSDRILSQNKDNKIIVVFIQFFHSKVNFKSRPNLLAYLVQELKLRVLLVLLMNPCTFNKNING